MTETQFSNLNKLRAYFSHMPKTLRAKDVLGCYCSKKALQTWLFWLLALSSLGYFCLPRILKRVAAPPGIISMLQLEEEGHNSVQKCSYQLRLSLIHQEDNNFHRNPTSRLPYLIGQDVTWLLLVSKKSGTRNF